MIPLFPRLQPAERCTVFRGARRRSAAAAAYQRYNKQVPGVAEGEIGAGRSRHQEEGGRDGIF